MKQPGQNTILPSLVGEGTVLKVAPFGKTNAIGLSAKVGFENDTLSASVATDMGFNLEGDKFEEVFDMDVAANFNWSFLTLDAYYATKAKSGGAYDDSVYVLNDDYTIAIDRELVEWKPIYGDPNNPKKVTGYEPVYEYYALTESKWVDSYKEDVLSFQAKFDLNAFEVPVAITASVKDVLHTVELGVKAEVTPVEGLKLTANAGYVIDTIDAYDKADWMRAESGAPATVTDKQLNDGFKEMYKGVFLGQWKFGLDAEYDFGFAKVAAGVSLKNLGLKAAGDAENDGTFDPDFEKKVNDKNFKTFKDSTNYVVNQVVLGMSASVSTESIIPGAELKLAWENADDLLSLYKYNADAEKYNFGKITASCTIEF